MFNFGAARTPIAQYSPNHKPCRYGVDHQPLNDCWVYSITTKEWTPVNIIPQTTIEAPQLVKRYFTFYVFGNTENGLTVYTFSSSNRWEEIQTKADFGLPRLEGYTVSHCLDRAIIYGGVITNRISTNQTVSTINDVDNSTESMYTRVFSELVYVFTFSMHSLTLPPPTHNIHFWQ
jgi:hypothetical protein